MRLDKFLANENIGSRKAVGVLVRSGAVTVNGQAVKKADMQVDPACDTVCVNGAPKNDWNGWLKNGSLSNQEPSGSAKADWKF